MTAPCLVRKQRGVVRLTTAKPPYRCLLLCCRMSLFSPFLCTFIKRCMRMFGGCYNCSERPNFQLILLSAIANIIVGNMYWRSGIVYGLTPLLQWSRGCDTDVNWLGYDVLPRILRHRSNLLAKPSIIQGKLFWTMWAGPYSRGSVAMPWW